MSWTSRLQGKVVLITGASSGIGAAAAKLFAQSGANVVLAARRAEKLTDMQRACEAASALPVRVATISLDVRSRESVSSVVSRLPDWAEHVDVLGACDGSAALTQ
jgi:hypothetical protein